MALKVRTPAGSRGTGQETCPCAPRTPTPVPPSPSANVTTPVGAATSGAPNASAPTCTGCPYTGTPGNAATNTPATTRPTFSFIDADPAVRLPSPLNVAVRLTAPNWSNVYTHCAIPSRTGTSTHPGTPPKVIVPPHPGGSTEDVIVTGCRICAGVEEMATTDGPLSMIRVRLVWRSAR